MNEHISKHTVYYTYDPSRGLTRADSMVKHTKLVAPHVVIFKKSGVSCCCF